MDQRSSALCMDVSSIQNLKIPDPHTGGNRSYRWCYSLHAFLCILHLFLLALLWHHPEHKITLPFDNSVLTVGLSAFLQAFYTLYTALLVFITQRLALSTSLSRRQKLTTTHDICEAWNGLGAALLTLWQQTKTAASIYATTAVFLYLACVSILHVASPTILQFQPYNASQTIIIPANSTWPDASVNLLALDWQTITMLTPLMSKFNSMPSTPGLANSTLYDVFTGGQNIMNASVNASTVGAKCGLLPILSHEPYIASLPSGAILRYTNVVTSFENDTTKNITTMFLQPWKDEIFLLTYSCAAGICPLNHTLLFGVSTAIEPDESIQNPVSVNATWNYTPVDGGALQSSNTTVYMVACSLYVSTHKSTLDVQSSTLISSLNESADSSQKWSPWTPANDDVESEALSAGVFAAMNTATVFGELPELFCNQGPQCFSNTISMLNVYLMSLVGVNAIENNKTAASESSENPSVTLTPSQMEASISLIAAEMIWLAGQLGERNGGFTLTKTEDEATQVVLGWRLNINKVPVFGALCASIIMLAIVLLTTRVIQDISISDISVLGILWISAHTDDLRNRFSMINYLSSDKLRSIGGFDTCLGKSNDGELEPVCEGEKKNSSCPFSSPEYLNVATCEEQMNPEACSKNVLGYNAEMGLSDVHRAHTQFIKNYMFWGCYILHAALVVCHFSLLTLFTRETKQIAVISLNSTWITTLLSASLQLFYILYTAFLVFITQRLALCRIMSSRHSLNTINDGSRSWAGVVSAISSLSHQRNISTSFWMTLCISVYLICVSILHIFSSTVMQFQMYNSTVINAAQSTLAWPNTSVGLEDLDWTNIVPLAPVIHQFSDLSTEGLFSNTVYDTPTVTPSALSAIVNATTIYADCGLLPGLPYNSNEISYPFKLSNTTIHEWMWNNTAISISGIEPSLCQGECDDYLFFFASTLLDINSDVLEAGSPVSVTSNLTDDPRHIYPTTFYFIGCSLSSITVLDTLFLQNDVLGGQCGSQPDAKSQPWTFWSPPNPTELNKMMINAMSSALLTDCNSFTKLDGWPCQLSSITNLDIYIMESLGINVTESIVSTGKQTPKITLGLSQFEQTVAELAARLIWLAGRMEGGFQRTNETSQVTDAIVKLRLNINIIPLSFILGASIIMFLLIFYLVGVKLPNRLPVSSLGVLETVWIESRSQIIHNSMLKIDVPSVNNLQRIGVLKICLEDEFSVAKENTQVDAGDSQLLTIEDE